MANEETTPTSHLLKQVGRREESPRFSDTFGIDPDSVGSITWDTMRSKISLPDTPINAIRWIMPDGTKIGTHDDDQHITLAGDAYRTLIEAGAIRVRGEGENGLIEMGRLPTTEQGAVLHDLYGGKKTIHVFLRRPGGVWRQGDNATVEGVAAAERWFAEKFGGETE